MTKPLRLLGVLILLAVSAACALAQAPEVLDADRRIIQYEKQNSELMTNLEYLCDMIGPRLTGSERLKKANKWTAQKMRDFGLENVHLESYTIPQGWERGKCEARVLEPNGLPIGAAAMAWTPGTRGTVKGPVVLFDPKDDNDLERFKGKLKNAIVLMTAPTPVNQHPSRETPGAGRRPPPSGTEEIEEAQQRPSAARMEFLIKEGAAVILRDAGKPMTLLNMAGSWMGFGAAPGAAPRLTTLFVANEHYAMLYRLLKRPVPVTMQVKVENRFVKGPVTVYNTVGEIRGIERPDEVVICGAHLDSWDLGTGAVDNGTGSMAVLETARILKALGLKPRRTIRFVLFSGEEQGLVGSREYVNQHKSEMDKISAVFVHDTGTGRVTGIGLHGNPQDQPSFEKDMPILKEIGVERYSSFRMGGTDHASFYASGVPGFWFMQDSADYNWMHHTQADTYDKALPDDMIQGATVMAICAYNVAQLPEMLPRRAVTTGSRE
jgi:carboxypeptidase Q